MPGAKNAPSFDPFAFDADKEPGSLDLSTANPTRLPFRNKRASNLALMQPVIKIPRVSVNPNASRAADNASVEMDIPAPNGSQGDRESPFTPTPEPHGFPLGPV